MSLEKGGNIDKKRRSGPLEAAAFATVLFGAMDQGPAQALEIPPQTPWSIAIKNNIRDASIKEKNESAMVYIKFSDGSSVWPSVVEGDETSVYYHAGAEMRHVLSKHGGKSVEARCHVHTHPYNTFLKVAVGVPEHLPYMPPSFLDVGPESGAEHSKKMKEFYAMQGVPLKNNVNVVADARGIWYHKSTGDKPVDEGAREKMREIYGRFMFNSARNKDFNFPVEYAKLQAGYQTYLNTRVRFVAYGDVDKEPPCADVDYKPSYKPATQGAPEVRRAPETRREVAQGGVGTIEVLKPEISIERIDTNSRPGLGEINVPRSRPRLDDQGPPYHVGPPQR